MDEPTILPLGLAPEGMPLPSGRRLIAVALGLAVTMGGSTVAVFLKRELTRIEKKFDSAVSSSPASKGKGCACCRPTPSSP